VNVGDVVRSKRSGRLWRIVRVGAVDPILGVPMLHVMPVDPPSPVPMWADQVEVVS
jgi:hypothetical protein